MMGNTIGARQAKGFSGLDAGVLLASSASRCVLVLLISKQSHLGICHGRDREGQTQTEGRVRVRVREKKRERETFFPPPNPPFPLSTSPSLFPLLTPPTNHGNIMWTEEKCGSQSISQSISNIVRDLLRAPPVAARVRAAISTMIFNRTDHDENWSKQPEEKKKKKLRLIPRLLGLSPSPWFF